MDYRRIENVRDANQVVYPYLSDQDQSHIMHAYAISADEMILAANAINSNVPVDIVLEFIRSKEDPRDTTTIDNFLTCLNAGMSPIDIYVALGLTPPGKQKDGRARWLSVSLPAFRR
jgi:hypothetical protein